MFEHGVEYVDAASGQAHQRGVVFLALGSFAVVVGPAGRVLRRGERGQEEGAFEVFVPGSGWVLAADAEPGSAGDGRQPGVGGQVAAGRERGSVTDFKEDAGSRRPRYEERPTSHAELGDVLVALSLSLMVLR